MIAPMKNLLACGRIGQATVDILDRFHPPGFSAFEGRGLAFYMIHAPSPSRSKEAGTTGRSLEGGARQSNIFLTASGRIFLSHYSTVSFKSVMGESEGRLPHRRLENEPAGRSGKISNSDLPAALRYASSQRPILESKNVLYSLWF